MPDLAANRIGFDEVLLRCAVDLLFGQFAVLAQQYILGDCGQLFESEADPQRIVVGPARDRA